LQKRQVSVNVRSDRSGQGLLAAIVFDYDVNGLRDVFLIRATKIGVTPFVPSLHSHFCSRIDCDRESENLLRLLGGSKSWRRQRRLHILRPAFMTPLIDRR
jgi:hypothetical protein